MIIALSSCVTKKKFQATQTEKEKIKTELQKFKGFWHNIMSHFHKRICYDKDNNYKIVIDDLYKNGIFDNNDNEIANNIIWIVDKNSMNA